MNYFSSNCNLPFLFVIMRPHIRSQRYLFIISLISESLFRSFFSVMIGSKDILGPSSVVCQSISKISNCKIETDPDLSATNSSFLVSEIYRKLIKNQLIELATKTLSCFISWDSILNFMITILFTSVHLLFVRLWVNEIEIWFKIYFSSCANRYHLTPFTETRDFLKQRVSENSRFLETFSIQYSKFYYFGLSDSLCSYACLLLWHQLRCL